MRTQGKITGNKVCENVIELTAPDGTVVAQVFNEDEDELTKTDWDNANHIVKLWNENEGEA